MSGKSGVLEARPTASGQAVLPTPAVRSIPDDAVFTLTELQAVLGLPRHTLRREARLGRLRTSRRAGRLWSTGEWVRQWLQAGEVKRRSPEASV